MTVKSSINKLTFYFQMILLTYVITLMIAKIVDQIYVTVVLNFSPLNSSSCSSSNAEDSLNCTVKNERNLNVLSLNCCGVKLLNNFDEP
jgi:hypothetical protein